MTAPGRLASFAVSTLYEELSEASREQLKIRFLDTLGCAVGAMDGEPIRLIAAQTLDSSAERACTLVGGSRAEPDRSQRTAACDSPCAGGLA